MNSQGDNRIKWFDAVRAFGLFLVLIYHLFYNVLPGGFLGVDIFFTFSGYLITALILEEVRKKQSFNLFKYYKRRMQRIMIPLFLAIAFTLPYALLISPDFTVGISKQLASALSFTSNWFFIASGSSYEAQFMPQMYTHLWTLAVLMQLYIAWGAVCALFSLITKAINKKNAGKRFSALKIVIIITSVAIAVCSFLYMIRLYNAGNDLNGIYFNTLARAFPFFIGSAAAAVWGMQPKVDETLKKRLFSNHKKLTAAGLILVVAVVAETIVLHLSRHNFKDAFIYRFGFLFTSLLTVVLIYCTHSLHILTPIKKKEPLALTIAAELSYDVYLVHWPLYIIISALIVNNVAASVMTFVMALIFSILMVYGVEKVLIPQNNTDAVKRKRAAKIAVSIILTCAVAAGGIVIAKAPAVTSIEANFEAAYIAGDVGEIVSLRRGIEAMNDKPVIYAGEESSLPANLLPSTPTSLPPAPTPATPSNQPPETSESPEPPPSTAPPYEPGAGPEFIPEGVTVIGDSVPLGAKTTMMIRIQNCYVDAEVNRTIPEGMALMQELQNTGQLREYVVIALGTNGSDNYKNELTRIVSAMAPGHRLIFVTPFDGRANDNAKWTNETSEWIRGLPAQYDFVSVADWNSTAASQVELLAGDKVHMGGVPSMELYSDVIAGAIGEASQKPSKG